MAQLSQLPTGECCSPLAQSTCCEPSAKAGCCGEAEPGGGCGCSAGAGELGSLADPPIACALGPAGLRERLGELHSIGAAALLSRRGRELRFRADADVRARLEAAVAAEAECCPFLALSLTAAGEELVLRIDAAAEALPIADEFAACFDRPHRSPSPSAAD